MDENWLVNIHIMTIIQIRRYWQRIIIFPRCDQGRIANVSNMQSVSTILCCTTAIFKNRTLCNLIFSDMTDMVDFHQVVCQISAPFCYVYEFHRFTFRIVFFDIPCYSANLKALYVTSHGILAYCKFYLPRHFSTKSVTSS